MTTSESINEIASALAEFQKEMPALMKSSSVSMELKSGRKVEYDYIELGELVKQSKDVLSKHGLSVIQPRSTINEKPVLITMLIHKSGQYIQTYSVLDLAGKTEQEKGSAITYNSRYDYVGMLRLGLLGEDDDGQAASKLKEISLGDYEVSYLNSKLAKKKLKEIPLNTLQEYVNFLKKWDADEVSKSGKHLTHAPAKDLEKIEKYLKEQSK